MSEAIAKNQKLGLPTDYASLSMPAETRMYVPKLQAVKNIVMHPQTYGLSLPPLQNHPKTRPECDQAPRGCLSFRRPR